jgi:hypothetical protein
MGFERYADYALDVPMYFVYRDGKYVDAWGSRSGTSWTGGAGAAGGEADAVGLGGPPDDDLPGGPDQEFMEMRGADGGPWRRICALPAFWVGLLLRRLVAGGGWDLCRDWTEADREGLRLDAAKMGLEARVRGPLAARRGARGGGDLARGGSRRGRGPGDDPGRDALPRRAAGGGGHRPDPGGRAPGAVLRVRGGATWRGSTGSTATEGGFMGGASPGPSLRVLSSLISKLVIDVAANPCGEFHSPRRGSGFQH